MSRDWKLSELRYEQLTERHFEVAVIPIGATEPHNLHLPYGTDNYEVEAFADRACQLATHRGAEVVLLPTIPYGVDSMMERFPLAIHVPQATLNRLLTDIIRSLERHGLRKIVILNGHGGNAFKPLLRDLYGRTEAFVTVVEWFGKIGEDVARETFVHTEGDHADEMETSLMLHLAPELVDLPAADAGQPAVSRFEAIGKGWAEITRPWHLLTTHSGHGDPRLAAAEKGERFFEVVAERIAGFLAELSTAELDKRFPY